MVAVNRLTKFLLAGSVFLNLCASVAPVIASEQIAQDIDLPNNSRIVPDAVQPNKSTGQELNLKGIIAIYEGPSPDQLVGGLVNQAIIRDKNNAALEERDKKMHGAMHKALGVAKETVHFAVEYRGFEMSSEGADIILDEKLKLKSENATDYAQQRKTDELHAKVFSSLLQIGQGLGSSDPVASERIISSGKSSLAEVVGPEAAEDALSKLKGWSAQLSVPDNVFKQQPWSMLDLQQKGESLLKESAQADPVMGLVRRALHKYNGHSKFALGAAKVINTSLNIAMFSPTIASPVAQILQFVYQMSTGGPEDSKLLTELYLDKRLECRWKRLNQESNQAINAYNTALLTNNPVLLGLSESFISALGGEDAGSKIIGQHKLIARKSTHNDAIDCVQTHTSM